MIATMVSTISIIILAYGAGFATPYVYYWLDWLIAKQLKRKRRGQ